MEDSNDIRYDHESRQALEKANFDMKMKIYYLEEELRKSKRNNVSGNDVESLTSEIESLKLQNQEKSLELEQRNNLLIKAKKAIEVLKLRVEQLQGEEAVRTAKHIELEERFEALKKASNEMEISYSGGLKDCHSQIELLKLNLHSKSEKNIDLEKSVASLSKRLDETLSMNMELNSRIIVVETKNEKLIEELTQSLAHEDLYKMQVNEIADENASMKALIHELKGVYGDLAVKKDEQDKEVLRLKESHEAALLKVKDEFAVQMLEEKLLMNEKLNERNAEIQHVNQELEKELLKHESVVLELQRIRDEFDLQRSKNFDNIALSEELKGKLHKYEIEIMNLNKSLEEIPVLKSKLVQSTDSLDAAHTIIREYEAGISSNSAELERLTNECQYLRSQLGEMNVITRENERLRLTTVQFEGDAKESVQQKLILNKDIDQLKEDLKIANKRINELLEAEKVQADRFLKLEQAKAALDSQFISAKSELARTEGLLAEQRTVYTDLQEDARKERLDRTFVEQQLDSEGRKLNSFQRDVGKASRLALNAMENWENMISRILEPSIFGGYDDDVFVKEPKVLIDYSIAEENSGEVLNNMTVRIERVNMVVHRLKRIREVLREHVSRVEDKFMSKAEIANDKISLNAHHLNDLSKKQDNLRAVFDRDRKLREEDSISMKNVKEHLLADCNNKIRESELKLFQLSKELDSEREIIVGLKEKLIKQDEYLQEARAKNDSLSSQVIKLHEVEEQVSHLKEKLQTYMENNKLLSFEVDDRGSRLESSYKAMEEVIKERDAVVEAAERLRRQILIRDENINQYKRDIDFMSEEIKVLRSRQMDPTLVEMIKSSQALLTHSTLPSEEQVRKSTDEIHVLEKAKGITSASIDTSRSKKEPLSASMNSLAIRKVGSALGSTIKPGETPHRIWEEDTGHKSELGSPLFTQGATTPVVQQPLSSRIVNVDDDYRSGRRTAFGLSGDEQRESFAKRSQAETHRIPNSPMRLPSASLLLSKSQSKMPDPRTPTSKTPGREVHGFFPGATSKLNKLDFSIDELGRKLDVFSSSSLAAPASLSENFLTGSPEDSPEKYPYAGATPGYRR